MSAESFKIIGGGRVAVVCVRGRCDLRCLFCGDAEPPVPKEREHLDELFTIVTRLARSEVSSIHWGLHHYEPTRFESLGDLIEYAGLMGVVDQELATSGVRTAEAGYLEALRDRGLRRVALTFFEWDDASSAALTGVEGVLARKLETLDRALALGLELRVRLLLMRVNYQRLGQMVDLVAQRLPDGGLDQRLTLVPVRPGDPGTSRLFLAPLTGWLEVARGVAAAHPELDLLVEDVPVCLWERAGRAEPNLRPAAGAGAGRPASSVDLPICLDCEHLVDCVGVSRDYLEAYGDGELTAGQRLQASLSLEALTARVGASAAIEGRPGRLHFRFEPLGSGGATLHGFVAAHEPGDEGATVEAGASILFRGHPDEGLVADCRALLSAAARLLGDPPSKKNRARWIDAVSRLLVISALRGKVRCVIDPG